MITGIERIREFGVFDNYSKPVEFDDFAENNIIYGWNYSGKTTISRLFQTIEYRQLHEDFDKASFAINISDGSTMSEDDLDSTSMQVRVFNSDFVVANLRWDGEAFDPILLLGDESIQAQKEIEKNEKYIDRMRNGYRKKREALRILDDKLRDAKTKKASQIKRALGLVEAYTAAHLNQQLPTVRTLLNDHLLDANDINALLKKALASDTDKLSEIPLPKITPNLGVTIDGISELLASKPVMTNTIQHLVDNGELAQWVKEGLDFHKNKNSCEFCGNLLSPERLQKLNSHFSEDLAIHEAKLRAALKRIEESRLVYSPFHAKDFYEVNRNKLTSTQTELARSVKDYNSQLESVSDAVKIKLKSPFLSVDTPPVNIEKEEKVIASVQELSKLVVENNQITKDFSKEKATAISRLKKHYVAEFCVEQDLDMHERLVNAITKNRDWYESSGRRLTQENARLEATISHAQKGREELNQFIDKFLSGSNITIEVLKIGDQERFRLTRKGEPARNLSEGEKTAIAFAFFLTKLKEAPDLDELIVYIDDPISSLDSNHLFQLNAVIRDFFYWKDADDNEKWKLRVKQIFFSTHNFEFLSLLKETPIRKENRCKYYYVKRLNASSSTLIVMPKSIKRYSSEYQYLWSVIHEFYISEEKDDFEVLLALPNAVRRFVELYTYSKIPSASVVTVDARAEALFGTEKSKRILKVLHFFSHSNNLLGISQNSDLICDIENVVNDLVEHIKGDSLHYNALMEAIT